MPNEPTTDQFFCPQCHQWYDTPGHRCPARVNPSVPREPPPARTQKAKGIVALAAGGGWSVPSHVVLSVGPESHSAAWHQAQAMLPAFARPCPIKPRHGFVDSRRVETMQDLCQVWKEATDEDPLAEVVVMSQINALGSAILAPGMVVLGPGNDGATSGHGSLSLPIRPDLLWPSGLLACAGIQETPYLEMVFASDYTPRAVQLRDGPEIPRARDFIPERMVVEHVVEAAGDLLAWEHAVSTMPKGTAVWHPGGSLASHYAVHCRVVWDKDQRNVPVLVSRQPRVGEVLVPVAHSPAFNTALVLRGLALGMSHPMPFRDACRMSLLAMHNSSDLGYAPIGSVVLGAGIAFAVRLGMCAALGESRHARRSKRKKGRNQNTLYTEAWTATTHAKRNLPRVLKLFDDPKMWHSNYGGRKWAACTRATLDLINRTILLARRPNSKMLASVIQQHNLVINQIHNGGGPSWFDKFTTREDFDQAAAGDARFIFRCIPPLYHLLTSAIPDECPFRRWHLLKEVSQPMVEEEPTEQETIQKLLMSGAIKTAPVSLVVLVGVTIQAAQVCMNGPIMHVQFKLSGMADKEYDKVNIAHVPTWVAEWVNAHSTVESFAESGKMYAPLTVHVEETVASVDANTADGLLTVLVLQTQKTDDDIKF